MAAEAFEACVLAADAEDAEAWDGDEALGRTPGIEATEIGTAAFDEDGGAEDAGVVIGGTPDPEG